MQVSVTYSEPDQQIWLRLDVPEEATLEEAIARSRILESFPHIDLAVQKVGIFGKPAKLDAPLKPGDRVEIYRAIICDPTTVPRRDVTDDDD
ncbi:MAG: RnfH family protein [Pseudomonadota bacterium]